MVHPHDLFSQQEPWTIRIRSLASEFKKQNHKIKLVYFPLNYTYKQKSFFLNGIEFIPLSRRLGIKIYIENIKFFYNICDWSDIVHFQKCFYHSALPAMIGAILRGKPLHYDWDDWEIKIFRYSAHQPWLADIFLSTLERFIPNVCDTISVSSQRLKQVCIKYGFDHKKIVMAPVGANLEEFNPQISGLRIRDLYNISGKIVTYLGQLHGGQYAEQFIKAAKIILNKKKGIIFMVVGGGYRLDELKKLSNDLGLNANFIFTGSIAHKDAPLYLAAADIVVACFEDNEITCCKSPLKIAEYLASGKMIVASDVGEVKAMLGGAGILTVPGEPQELSDGILKFLSEPPLGKRLAKKARNRAEEIYNWTNTANNILKAYAMSL